MLLCLVLVVLVLGVEGDAAKDWMDNLEKDLKALGRLDSIAYFVYDTNLTDYNQKLATTASGHYSDRVALAKKNIPTVGPTTDAATKRKFMIFQRGGTDPTDKAKRDQLATVMADMEELYSKATYNGKNLQQLSDQLRDWKNESAIREAWVGWRQVSGKKLKSIYATYIDLMNLGARDQAAKYPDAGAAWRSEYEVSDFEQRIDTLWTQVRPLYEQLHCYVRRKLREKYGTDIVSGSTIPAHLTGNMWAQDWSGLYDMMIPYPNETSIDITPTLLAKKYNATTMHKTAEGFYTSLGMQKLPDTFWKRSMLTRPSDGRDVVCHASAWDMNDGDVRIKMCTQINSEDLEVCHHEQGHCYYYLYYQKQPWFFAGGGNAGFHEAIGDTTVLSMSTSYLKKIGLIPQSTVVNSRMQLNLLMLRALGRVAFLPFGILMDKWRWQAFAEGSASNAQWWAMRQKYQGVSPPVGRTPEDFDPGAKYHIASSTPYIRYFVAYILQFQFHKTLCAEAGYKGPLHDCSIYGSKAAGKKLMAMLSLGASQPWTETLKEMTGSDKMNATAIVEYFQPLMDWLKEQNKGETCGWGGMDAKQGCDKKQLSACFLQSMGTQLLFKDKCAAMQQIYDCYTATNCPTKDCQPKMEGCSIKCPN